MSSFVALMPEVDASTVFVTSKAVDRAALDRAVWTEGWIDEAQPMPTWIWPDSSARPPDWLTTVDGARVVSPRTRELLAAQASALDEIQWVPVTLRTPIEDLPYALMHFPSSFDAYDESTIWGRSGLPIRWALSAEKCAGRSVFGLSGMRHTIVDLAAYQALVRAEIRGVRVRDVDLRHGR